MRFFYMTSGDSEEFKKAYNYRLKPSMVRKLEVVAKARDTNVTVLVTEAITEYLEKYNAQICESCHYYNKPDSSYCGGCGLPLTETGKEKLELYRRGLKENPALLLHVIQDLKGENP